MSADPVVARRRSPPPMGSERAAPPPHAGRTPWLIAGITIGIGVGIGVLLLWDRQRGGQAGPQLTETRFQRDEEGFVTATQTITAPAVGGAGMAAPPGEAAEPAD